MGYTHYWTQTRSFTDPEWGAVTEAVKRIILEADCDICNAYGDEGSKPEFGGRAIMLNGRDENTHETFQILRIQEPGFNGGTPGWDCTKTARKPYDVVVTACLTLLQSDYGYEINSDGGVDDWDDGVDLAERALDRVFANPLIVAVMAA